MSAQTSEAIVKRWWDAFNTGDYAAAASLLAPEAIVDWPLSGERLATPQDWQAIKEHYPAHTPWQAEIIELVVNGEQVVSFAQVFDGSIIDFAISRFTVRDGKIVSLVEFWPETYAAPTWRNPWVTAIPDAENPLKRLSEGIPVHGD